MELQPFEAMQEEVSQWSLYNFGEQGAYRPLLGMFEEIDECAKARDRAELPEIRDAVGDICIYMMNYCAIRGWSFAELYDSRCNATSADAGNDLGIIGTLSHHHLKGEQGIRGKAEAHDFAAKFILGHLLWKLELLCAECHMLFHAAVQETWNAVKQRDWRKNSYDGSVPRPVWLLEAGEGVVRVLEQDMPKWSDLPSGLAGLVEESRLEMDAVILGAEFTPRAASSSMAHAAACYDFEQSDFQPPANPDAYKQGVGCFSLHLSGGTLMDRVEGEVFIGTMQEISKMALGITEPASITDVVCQQDGLLVAACVGDAK